MDKLLSNIKSCDICTDLPHGTRPVLTADIESQIVIIGQAPGWKVHESGIPWDDQSGDNLREWLNVDKKTFYNTKKIAIIPMGFCYPGKGKSGDLPPRKICAKTWHQPLFDKLKNIKLIILVGKYAQDYYLENPKKNLTETVRHFEEYLPQFLVLPHPSPRNNIWRAKNDWFDQYILPQIKTMVNDILD